jgi:hypothetical protein
MFKHTELLISLIRGCEYYNYLELGVSDGLNIKAIVPHVRKCIGVDINDVVQDKTFDFHHCMTDEFFVYFKEDIDLVFIDANHDFEFVKRDLLNSFSLLTPNGLAVLHDTNPLDTRFITHETCSDAYKIVDYVKNECPYLNIVTLPWEVTGISLVSRVADMRIQKFIL